MFFNSSKLEKHSKSQNDKSLLNSIHILFCTIFHKYLYITIKSSLSLKSIKFSFAISNPAFIDPDNPFFINYFNSIIM